MGYTSTCEGEFKIVPPLTHRETKRLNVLVDQFSSDAEIKVSVRERVTESDLGDVISFEAFAIKPKNPNEEWKRYDTVKQVQEIVTAFPDHEFPGYFEFLGEDGERWRLVVRNGRMKNIEPVLIWPEVD